MIRCWLVTFLLIFSTSLFAQRQFPPLHFNFDSVINLCYNAETDEHRTAAVNMIDKLVQPYERDYPLFRGLVYMYQAYWTKVTAERATFLSNGYQLIHNNKQFLADSFPFECRELLGNYAWSKRIKDWLPVDSILRSSITPNSKGRDLSILNYADKKLKEGHYFIARNLALYDVQFYETVQPKTADFMLAKVFSEWTAINSKYVEWKAIPYYERDETFTLKQSFNDFFRHIKELTDSLVKLNRYGTSSFKLYQRSQYYRIYKEAVMAFSAWSIAGHREGQAIIPLKNFLLDDLVPNELKPATEAGATPVINCKELLDMYARLVDLYLNMGNGKSADEVANHGINLIENLKSCAPDDRMNAITFLFYQRIKANRVEGKYAASLNKNQLLKRWWSLPKSVSKEYLNSWNLFMEARMQEAYTLIAIQDHQAAADSLDHLFKLLAPLDSAEALYKSYQWPHLQYLSMTYIAQRGNWETVKNFSLDALKTVEQENHWEDVPYYYDLQLLYFISRYRVDNTILKNVIANLLFYTGRHLQHTFFMLTPEERIRLYEQKLSRYFDVYHELVWRKLIDNEPKLKEQIISQSLFLKNALVDANLLPNEFLAQGEEWLPIIEEIRESKRSRNIVLSRWRMRKQEDMELNNDDVQALWLQLLGNANLDSLVKFTGWKKIASALHTNQVYVEVVRYTNQLSDSSSMYGAYVISNGKLELLNLFNERELTVLLKDPSASPQSPVLNATNTRGLTLTKKDTAVRLFKVGSEDKIGTLVLSKLWQHLNGKTELLLVADGLLNRISIAALEYLKKPFHAQIKLRQLSGSYVLHQKQNEFPAKGTALLVGGLNYNALQSKLNVNRLLNRKYSWQYLPATKKEIDNLQTIFSSSGHQTTLASGSSFPDTLREELTKYNFIHLATHGFYVDSSTARTFYDRTWDKEAIQNDPMMRCGIAVSDANFPDPNAFFTEGHLLGFELANTDLRKCYLITLSACETGLGDLRNNLGVDGLSRALKLGGARFLLISLWKVPDEPTAVFMQHFYKELFKLKDPAAALQSTQAYMSKKYSVADWAAFVLVE
jgi:CHAT domain-containing protein